MEALALQEQIEIPCLREGSPAPSKEVRPSTKLTEPYFTEGMGFHLSWFGWQSKFYFCRQLAMILKGYLDFSYCPSIAEGRSLQYQTFWFSDLLTVKAVPDSCSAQRPYLSLTGLFWPEQENKYLQEQHRAVLRWQSCCRSHQDISISRKDLNYPSNNKLILLSHINILNQTVMEQAKGLIRTIATAEDPSLVRCFRGHEKAVTSVGFSKEMKQMVSGGSDGLVEVWNFKPQIRPFKFVGHKGQVNDVLFNSDSSKVISCGDDRQIRIWKNSVNGKHKSVKAHSGPVLKLSLSHQEDFLMSCSSDKTIKMWDLEGKFKQSFVGHTNWVRQCQISFDQRLLLSCSDDRSVKLWDITKATVSATFLQHKSQVLSCKFTPDGTCIAASATDGTIKVWDTRLGKLIQHYNAHDRPVNRIAFHPLGYHMASVSSDNKIKIWELKQGRLGWTVFGHEGQIRTIDFNEKGDYFATGGDDKLVMIWMSNFDRELNSTGRGVEQNFKEKVNGDGVQPLFKSNKLGLQVPAFNQTQNNNIINELNKGKSEVRSERAQKISQLMSFQLQKIVNQLELITRSLDFIDRSVSDHEKVIDKLLNSEKIDQVFEEMQEKQLMGSQIVNSAWQAHKNIEGEEQVNLQSRNQEQFQLQENEDEYEKFMMQEQAKRRQFQEQLNLEEQGLQFKIGQVQVQNQF